MKGKFGIVALLVSSIAFAGPVSAPNNLSDTPIISGGGTVSGGVACRAYQNDGTAVPLSGGETLAFYASGGRLYDAWRRPLYTTHGGYLSTKSNYSGTAYVKVKGNSYLRGVGRPIDDLDNSIRWFVQNTNEIGDHYSGSAIGLFAQNTDRKTDFIAGAGAGGSGGRYDLNAVSGGGWVVQGMGIGLFATRPLAGDGGFIASPVFYYGPYTAYGGRVYGHDSLWFTTWYGGVPTTPGFHSSPRINTGAASSISAFYNSYTKNYTSFSTSLTISGGGYYGPANPTLYVCQ